MKRNPRKKRWTKAFRKASGKELAIDSTFEFEKKRNIPIRYDREKVRSILNAMERVQEIKSRRERQFYINRMHSKKEAVKKAAVRDIQRHVHLVSTPALETAAALQSKRQKQTNLIQVLSKTKTAPIMNIPLGITNQKNSSVSMELN
jgi:large subunit ribosomal protein L24e